MSSPLWIWQNPEWPHFTWQAEQFASLLRACIHAQGGLQAMPENIVTSSAIEGEPLNVGSVRASLPATAGVQTQQMHWIH
ncbi:hypothetical protein ASF84_20185 [Pseudomonas sp. Leaf127]|nr:hypothetical protein ASF84_20185 [Pseudomonas sp. Leaf127]